MTTTVTLSCLDPLFVRAMTWTADLYGWCCSRDRRESRSLIRQGNDLDSMEEAVYEMEGRILVSRSLIRQGNDLDFLNGFPMAASPTPRSRSLIRQGNDLDHRDAEDH